MMTASSLDYILWSASVRTHSYRARLDAAAAGGFTSLAMTPHEYREATRNGLTATDLLEMAAETGIALRHLDTVTGWAPIRFPSGAGADIVERFNFSMEEVLDIASSIEAETLLAFPAYDRGAVPLEVAVEGFANLCDRAEEAGLWVNLEFAPMLGLPNLSDAWEVVRLADRPNSGIMLDTWHFARGDADLGLLRSIPGERLRDVQLADGARIPRGNSLLEDCVRFRMFPGEGDLPIIEPLRIIYGKGSLRSVGPEVFSDSADALSAEEAGRLSGTSLRHALRSAGIRARSP